MYNEFKLQMTRTLHDNRYAHRNKTIKYSQVIILQNVQVSLLWIRFIVTREHTLNMHHTNENVLF